VTAPAGVLVMAHGTPASVADIAPFYTRIRRGRPPTDDQLADLQRRYEAIGGLSPLAERTQAQVDALRHRLDERAPGRYVVAFGAKHADPLIEDAVGKLVATGVGPVIGLVLTPHGSSRGSEEYLERARHALGPREFIAVSPWYAAPPFIAAVGARVARSLAASEWPPARCPVLFTAHSVPQGADGAAEGYRQQLETSAQLAATAAGVTRWHIAWQSAGRTSEPWLGPDVREVIRDLGQSGEADAVIVCPIGFVADHLEVLYDLDIEAAAVAASCGLGFARTESLNDDPGLISALASAVALADATRHTS
jgi:ferrochelatase